MSFVRSTLAWSLLLPLWRRLIPSQGWRTVAATGTAVVWLVVIIAIAAAAGGDGDEETAPVASKLTATPAATAAPKRSATPVATPTAKPAVTPVATPTARPAATATPAPEPVAPLEPQPQTVQGSGQQVSSPVALEEGLTIFRMTHAGGSNFAIWLLNQSTGERLDLLVNEIGPFDGAKAVGIQAPGNYVLDITADGGWTVTVEQPRPTSAPAAPQTFTGFNQSVSPPFTVNRGLATFRMTHDGSSNFAIWLIDSKGELVELLVNEIGPFDGSKAVSVTGGIFAASPGIHFLGIAADGNWTISVEQ